MEPPIIFPSPPEVTKALQLLSNDRIMDAVPLLERAAAFMLIEELEQRLFHIEDLNELGLKELLDNYMQRSELFQALGSTLHSPQPELIGQLEQLTTIIRSVKGFGRFLVAPDFQQLADLGYPDTVVYVVCGEENGWAVLMKPGNPPSAVRLPQFTRAAVQEQALSSRFIFSNEPDYARAAARLDDIAAWCWGSCMEHVCGSLAADSKVTLIPIGPVGMLPLHIAFTPSRDALCGRKYALDHLVISYAPNLRIAAFSRRPPGPPVTPRITALAPNPASDADPAGGRWALPFSAPEVRYVSGLYPSAPGLIGTEVTPATLFAGLRDPGIVHFAGHARASLGVSGASFLRFGDSLLTLNDLRSLRDAKAELVVLSACVSTLTTASHPEQAITFGNVLLACGVRGVVATMWRVIDDASALLACRFHQMARKSPTRVPEALRAAQQWLRDASPTARQAAAREIGVELETEPEWWSSPIAWGAFIHCGSAGSRGLTGPRHLPRPRVSGFDPCEVADYYSFPAGYDGSGVSIAVVDLFGDFEERDLDAYFAATQRARPVVERIQVGADSASRTLDELANAGLTGFLQTVGSVAPGARLVVYLAENNEGGIDEGLSEAISANDPPNAIICLTMGDPEFMVGQSTAGLVDHFCEIATAMGKIVCAAALEIPLAENSAAIRPVFPGSHPLVLACAATQSATDTYGFVERPGPPAESGSQIYPRPEWQATLGPRLAAGSNGCLVPDVACLADTDHGYRCLIDGKWAPVGGDAFAVAIWAGLLARLNQALGGPWGLVQDLYTNLGPHGALKNIPQGASGRPSIWRPDIGWGVPDGDRILALLRRPSSS